MEWLSRWISWAALGALALAIDVRTAARRLPSSPAVARPGAQRR
jgi:hypothetical protein